MKYATKERVCGVILNISILVLIVLCVYQYNYRIYWIRLFVLAHTGLTLGYIYLIPRFGHYTKVQEKRSTNIVVLLVRYFIVVEYNTVYTAIYI